ncbi:sulfite dehydrogenase [Marinimicrococcus flavescens]|uniref:Sulfite dehydrogenase n=1 Tax=Marinimicrococcus flavescens TaxID=3031815 RepID=A0AAP3UYG1_9PROT|nr:sulfite dehydrogenase [Marinimicrococcus flavescens]
MNKLSPPASAAGEESALSRRKLLSIGSGSVAGGLVAHPAIAGSLADVPPRAVGDPVGATSERSTFVDLARITEATPGKRNVDPLDAINSKTPLHKLDGTITPSDLHYERSHSGIPALDPKTHRLLVHGMSARSLVLDVGDLRRMPSISRMAFIECSGNGWENWKNDDDTLTVQHTHGLVSTHEWTGVRLSYIAGLVGRDPSSRWMLAEGGDASGMARSIPMTEEILGEAMIAYAQNGEPLRPAHGYPMRLLVPGWEGNLSVKWLRRLRFGDRPFYTRWETSRYTSLMPDGKARQFQLRQEVNSVITSPSGMMEIAPGYNRITGLAWSGHGAISKVEISTDAGRTWQEARLNAPVLPKAQARFQLNWHWDGKPTFITSRATDEKGHVQPTREALIGQMGKNALFHYNGQQIWRVNAEGSVRHALS